MPQRRPVPTEAVARRSTRREPVLAPPPAPGASVAGLEAVRGVLEALPAGSGRTVILVQHAGRTDGNIRVELVTDLAPLTVFQALSDRRGRQSNDEELLRSKAELQTANQDLAGQNTRLQEMLERQLKTSSDLQNMLYSTDVACLFLDASLNIRFFTPATKALFNILPGDIGRPLADLNSAAADSALADDACAVLKTSTPVERDIETSNGVWFARRMLPYRGHDNAVQGVVITYTDITERKRTRKALEEAKRDAELANVAKSRFLAAASHDLRQPLQSLAFLQGLLAKSVQSEREKELVKRLEQSLGAMSDMLNTLLDINQIEVGVVRPNESVFPIGDILLRLRDEFAYHAQARGVELHVAACNVAVRSDPALLEQMIRNLVSNALKYTPKGRVLVGCRRREGLLSIEIWDTGIGIAAEDQQAIFAECHQVDNAARERSRGMGLGLSIVQRLGELLGHRVQVRSWLGKGSIFTIEAPISEAYAEPAALTQCAVAHQPVAGLHRTGKVLVIEDDPDVRDLLVLLLRGEGHRVAIATEASNAMDFIARGGLRPDVIVADYNLPGGMTGLEVVAKIRERLNDRLPAIILTGDISAETLRLASAQDCIQLNKPVKLADLTRLIQDLLPPPRPHAAPATDGVGADQSQPIIFVVDDNPEVREGLCSVLEEDGRAAQGFATAEAFLAAYDPSRNGCLLIDAGLPGMSGRELLERLHTEGRQIPAIMMAANSNVAIAVHAMKAGVLDFIEKPVAIADLLASVDLALDHSRDETKLHAWRANAAQLLAGLTHRQHQVMDMVLAGHPSKNIAADLGISQRTVETHRASIMKKTGSKSLPALARIAVAAAASAPAWRLDSGM